MKPLFFRNQALSGAAVAALGLALIVGLGTPPATAQFVCEKNPDAGDGGATAAGGSGNVACGPSANASGTDGFNVAIGSFANASGDGGFNAATGFDANASGAFGRNTATGLSTNASGANSFNTATGGGANASGDNSNNTATGASANASGNGSLNIATGYQARANGEGSANIAMGYQTEAGGNGGRNIAIGRQAISEGMDSANVAIGDGARAMGVATSNTAVGSGSRANFANSAAFGAGATVTRPNQQIFGTASNSYTMPGINAGAAFQSGPTQLVTSDSGGNLATASAASLGLASSADISAINTRLDKANTGVAMAFAMAGVPTLLPNETMAFTSNWGTFEGSNGLALNAAYRVAHNVQLNGGVAYGLNDKIAGGRVGLRIGW